MTQEQTLDRKDLKIKALLEKLNEKEEVIADLRVDLFLYAQALQESRDTTNFLQGQVQQLSADAASETEASTDEEAEPSE